MIDLNNLKARNVEAEGFQAGTQGVPAEAQLREIDSGFARLKEGVKQRATVRIKEIEGRIETFKRRLQEAEKRWSNVQARSDGMAPGIVLPLCAVVIALVVVAGEAIFLAPVMDALGIANWIAQLVFAGVIVMVTSGLVKVSKRQLLSHTDKSEATGSDHDQPGRKMQFGGYLKAGLVVFLTLISLTFVFFLGWWRAEQMIFAATLQHSGAWKQFMSDNQGLTRAVVVLLTTGLPIFVAIVFDWGLENLRLAWEWRKARSQSNRFSKKLNAAQKRLEAELEARESRLAELDKTCDEWKGAYEHHHALGREVGAWKTPLWRVILKIAAVVLVIAAICLVIDPYLASYIASDPTRWFIYALVTLGLGGFYAASAIRTWDRPNAKQLLKQRATIWQKQPPRQIEEKPQVGVAGESAKSFAEPATVYTNGAGPAPSRVNASA